MRSETAAAYLEISMSSLTNLTNRCQLIPVDSGAGKRYRKSELDRFIQSLSEWDKS